MIPCVELLFLGESVFEVECGAGIYHRPCHLIVPDSFGIVHLASLWLHHSANGEQIPRTYDAQLQVSVCVLPSASVHVSVSVRYLVSTITSSYIP